MDRDWMTTGRRPSGLCGAAIIISSRIHGFKRNTKQITDVVHVCDETIKRRLDEFTRTTTAKMTPQDLDLPDKLNLKEHRDPPAFTRNRMKEKEFESIKKHADEIQKCFKEPYPIKDQSETCERTSLLNQSESYTITSKASEEMKIDQMMVKDNEELSDIEDEEASRYIVSNDEYKLKKLLWEILFNDWIEEQKEKKKVEKKQEKKKMRKLSRLETTVSRDPVEAIKNSNRFGKKINFNLLNSMFVKNKYN